MSAASTSSSSSSASSSGSQGPPTPPPVERPPPSALVESLSAFAQHLRTNEHVLATEDGDKSLAGEALEATKRIFDLALSLEPSSHPHIHRLITQLTDPASLPSTAPTTRPTTRQSRKKSQGLPSPSTILPHTPLDSLYTENGLGIQAIWDQMEMRTGKVGDVLQVLEIGSMGPVEDDEEAGQGAGQAFDEEDDDEGDDDEEEDDLTPEEKEQWEALLREKPEMFSEWESDEEEEDEEAGESDEEEEEEEESDEMEVDEDEDDEEQEEEDEDEDELDDENEEDDLMEGLEDEEGDEDDEDEHEDEHEDEDETEPVSSCSKPNHPTLDDQFFSIDAFNRFTEETEATSTSSGSLGKKKKKGKSAKGKGKRKGLLGEEDEEEDDDDNDDEDEEDDLGLDSEVGDLFGGDILAAAGDEGDNMMYADFFPPPREWTREKPVKGKGKADGKDKPKKTKKKVDTPQVSGSTSRAEVDGRDIMTRVRTDLFADDDEADEDEPAERLSTHEKRLRALQEQISSFEQENVGKKEWTLLGEVKARERPQNSMLEEDLEFEQMGKVVPIVTEDKVVGLEEMIKRRILDGNFDDVVRRRELDDKAFIPSRYFELENSASSKSLAQIYEDDYKNASGDGKVVDARDAKLNKDHEEIDALWGEICYKLDALSNLNFTPKQPKAAITTLSNVATTSMENALPTTQSTSTMLAPEEVFAPASKSDLVARSELDPLQKKRMRQKERKTRMRQRQALDSAVDKFAGKSGGGGKARGGVKSQKDRALKELVKTGKGVTVVGKYSVKKPRKNDRESVSQSATLKL